MGIESQYLGEINIPEEHRAEYAQQALKLLRAGGMVTVEPVQLYGHKLYLLSSPELDEEDGKVVGVDVDQSSESETVVTSAMKGLSDAAEWAIAKVYDGTFSEIGGVKTALGVTENAVGLPTATWSMENFSVADYEDLFQKVLNGDITIDNNDKMADPSTAGLSNVNVNYIGG